MFNKDIIRLYNKGIRLKCKDSDLFTYNHYLLGKSTCTFKYIKQLHKIKL